MIEKHSFRHPAELSMIQCLNLSMIQFALSPNSRTKSSTRIVSSRSGPVEINPTRAPVSFSMNARYSRAAFGNPSNVYTLVVGMAQPGILQ